MRTGHLVSHMTGKSHGIKRVIMSWVPSFQALEAAEIGTPTVDVLNYTKKSPPSIQDPQLEQLSQCNI